MLIIFGGSLAFSAVTNYYFHYQESKKNIISNIPFSEFIYCWGFDLGLIFKIIVYGLLYALTLFFMQIGFTVMLVIIAKIQSNFVWQYYHLDHKGKNK